MLMIASGVTDQVITFFAADATDLITPETGLSSFTVYRSRNGGTPAAFTTPTVTELDSTNMPGWYKLLLDEDMTIDSGDETQDFALHITQASMAPVRLKFCLFRPKVTAGETLTVAGGLAALISAYDFAKGTEPMTEAYAANGAAPTPIEALYGIQQMLQMFGISGTSLTVKKLDNSTTAFVVTLDDATSPTGAART